METPSRVGDSDIAEASTAGVGQRLSDQAWGETAAKSRRGIIAFPAAFLLVASLSGELQRLEPFALGCGAMLFLGWLARVVLVFRFDRLYAASPGRWRLGFVASLLSCAGAWGLYSAWLEMGDSASPASPLAVLITTALVGQAVVMYSASFGLVAGYIGVMVLPLLWAWLGLYLSGRAPEALWLALGGVIYSLYCLASARAVSRHLYTRLRRSEQLREARDRLESEVVLRAQMHEQVTAELQEREREYQRIYRQAHDAILVIEPDTEVVLEANERACEIYGFDHHELVGMSLIDVSINPDLGREKVAETLEVGHYLSFETQQRRKDGSVMDLEVNASVIQYRGQTAILSINRDVTDRKRAEEMRLAKESAERMSEAKSQFLANMSHEIRTPMAGMIGLSNLLRQSDLEERERGWVETLHSSAESLLLILDDVLDLSKIEDGKLELETRRFDLCAEVERVVALARVRAESQGLDVVTELAPDLPKIVIADPGRLRQVLLNLLSNAVKFTPAGQVTVSVSWSPEEPSEPLEPDETRGLLGIAVRDTGIGIEREHQERIFETFTQSDASTNRRYGGTGLGLAICRRLVGLMGGEIALESEPRRGSEFRFTVPVAVAPDLDPARNAGEDTARVHADGGRPEIAASEIAATAPATATGSLDGRVLLVEDNEVNRLVALAELERLGVEAEAACDGAEALGRLRSERFDLVLMDVQMPGLDGYETTRRIRAGEAGDGESAAHTPIVALTAHALQDDREKCLAAGMDDYLAKPVRQDDLAAMLARWLGAR